MEENDVEMMTRHEDSNDGAMVRGPFCNLYRLCKLCRRWPEDNYDMI